MGGWAAEGRNGECVGERLPLNRGWSNYRRELKRGLNTEVTQSLTSAATVLVELVEDQHGRDEHTVTQVHGPQEEVKLLRPACLY